jgi:hypothetical protein
MPEVLTRQPESKHDRNEWLETKRPTSPLGPSPFKYYIHDSVKQLRLQLIGDLRTSNVTDLNGTWETAKTTLGQRRLVLDLRQLYSADEEGRLWLAKMKDGGGSCLPATFFQIDGQMAANTRGQEAGAVKLSLIGRLLGLIRH